MSYPEKLPSGKWRGVYRLADGTKRSKTFTHKRAAERWAAAEEQKVADGRMHDPHAGRIRWGEWRLRWFPARSTQASTTRTGDSRIRCHLAPRWDDVALNAITTTDAQAWVTSMTRSGMPSNSVRGTFHLLSGSLRAAVRDGLIETNPCTGVRLPPLPAEPERFLTFEETEALHAVLRGPYRVLVELLLETGMRLGEAVSLHRHRIDFESRRISVVESWGQVDRVVRTHTKWGHSRVVPMSNRLEAVLIEWLGYTSPPTGATRCAYNHEEGERCRSELAIVGPRGAMIDPTNFTYRVFAKALKESSIGYARPHDLRHTWASRLITAGVPLQRLQRWGGWESYEAMRRYAKLMDSGDDDFRLATDMGPRGAERGATRGSARSRQVSTTRRPQPV